MCGWRVVTVPRPDGAPRAVLRLQMHETEAAYSLCQLEDVQLFEGISLQRHL